MVTAIILINAARHRVAAVAEELADFPEITEVYTVAGQYDLVALIRVPHNDGLANLVTQKMPNIDGIERTESLIAFRAYSRHDLENLFSVGL